MNLTEEELLTISDDVARGDRDAETYRAHLVRAMDDLHAIGRAHAENTAFVQRLRAKQAFLWFVYLLAGIALSGLTGHAIVQEKALPAVLYALLGMSFFSASVAHARSAQTGSTS